ncbi:hypothetical protein RIB2604_01805090 [Aspergillus luchuensis]|uniref:Uncharacterized protein n=1 Tax=Aspergillus kawachii TaxID=1069201 RepID=A0A146FGK6_ASPKA|nr:hypothetical protein RIB2604_01805090 [Aspergillus luchuensis]
MKNGNSWAFSEDDIKTYGNIIEQNAGGASFLTAETALDVNTGLCNLFSSYRSEPAKAKIIISRLQETTTTGGRVPQPTAVRKDIPKCRTGAMSGKPMSGRRLPKIGAVVRGK